MAKDTGVPDMSTKSVNQESQHIELLLSGIADISVLIHIDCLKLTNQKKSSPDDNGDVEIKLESALPTETPERSQNVPK